MPETPGKLPDFVAWPSFPFDGDLRIKPLEPVVETEPPREGEDAGECAACNAKDEAYIWVSERWRVRALDQPSGLPMVLILESRSHLDLGDLPNLLAAELGVMTVRLERAIRSLDGVARVHVNRWGDGAAHLHLWFFARPVGRLQLRGSFLSMWDDILPPIAEETWRENLALVAAWLAEFGGRPLAEPPRIAWQAPATLAESRPFAIGEADDAEDEDAAPAEGPAANPMTVSAASTTESATAVESVRTVTGSGDTSTGWGDTSTGWGGAATLGSAAEPDTTEPDTTEPAMAEPGTASTGTASTGTAPGYAATAPGDAGTASGGGAAGDPGAAAGGAAAGDPVGDVASPTGDAKTAEVRTDELIELPAPREPESAKQKAAAPASA